MSELEQEKKIKADKKTQLREAAMKVFQENLIEKKTRMTELVAKRQAEVQLVETNVRLELEREQAREREMAARGAKIQACMDSMAEVVKDNGKALQKRQEKEYI